MKKRIYTLAAVLLLAFCIFTPIQADEIERVEVECSGVLQAGGLLEEQPAVYSKVRTASAVGADIDGAKQAMVEAATELKDTVNLSKYNISENQILTVFTDFLNENPRLFYISNRFSYLPINGYVSSIYFIYEDAKSDIPEMLEQYDAEVNKILSNTKTEWSDLEKILFVNDYLALNCEYEEGVYEDSTIDAHDAYDVLVKKKAVCQGYALAFRDLMNHLNVTCELVTSDVMCHAWNMVQVGGNWYHVDVTWNDPTKDKLGRARHFYLLKSQSFFLSTEGGHNAYDYVYSDSSLSGESASEKKFDTAAWNNIDSAFWYYGDCWYAIEETSDANITAYLKAYKLNDEGIETSDVKKSLTETWDIQGTSSQYVGSFSYTWLVGDTLYYNLPKKVMAYDLVTGDEDSVYNFEDDVENANRIYELRVEGYEVSIGLAPNLEKDTVVTKEIIYLNHEHQYDRIVDCTVATKCTLCGQVAVKATAHIPVGEQTNCLEPVKCKVCTKNAIEVKPSHTHNGVIDCTVDTMCTECDQIAVPKRESHEAGKITDCTKATKCQHCNQMAIQAGEREHTPDTIIDCTQDTLCKVCGQVAVKATAHIPVGEQTNCLKPVKCKVCTKNAIEVKPSHTHNGVTDCMVDTKCTECGQIAVPARKEHEAGEITDCTKATKCQHCEQMAIQAGEREHTPDTIIDCTKDTLCKVCDQVAVEATAHIPVGEQTNCLEPVKCKVCTKNAIEAKTSHTHNGVTDCTVDTMCTECGQIAVPKREGHEAGKITDCTKATKCQHCEHTMVPTGSHTYGTILDCTKATPCTVCGKTAVSAKSHTPVGSQTNCLEPVKCAVCTKNAIEAKLHTPGPAATCTTNQTCTTCHALLANAKGHTPYENVTEATFLNAKTVDTYCSTCHQHLSNTTIGDKLTCKKGAIYTVGNYKYKIISNKTNGKGTVAFHGLAKNMSQVVIGNTVVIHGVKFNITEISAKALKKKTKVTALTIGSNIQKIGKEAFYGMSKAKKITIKTTKLTSVGKNALKSIYKKATIKVPKSRLSKYKKLLKGKGQSSSVKITK